jgi:hypothetical protein
MLLFMQTRRRGRGEAAETLAWQRLEKDLPPLPDPSGEDDIVWQQLRANFGWYHKAATRTRLAYQAMKTVSLLVAAIVPVVAAASAPAILTACLAAVVVVLEGAQQLFQLQIHWITYRGTAEVLRQHAFMYAGQVGPYCDPETRRASLAEFVLSAVSEEQARWSTVMRRTVAATPPASS